MMGSGKTSVGRRLAARLGLDFADADAEIETAAGMSVPEIFAKHGEAYFRDGERRVVARLLEERQRVLATGGGAFMSPQTRENVAARGISIWLKADIDVLLRRVRKRSNRPLLSNVDAEETLRRLMAERYPVYGLADFTVMSREGPHEVVIDNILAVLEAGLAGVARLASPAPSASVRVGLGDRAYDILIGPDLIASAGEHIARVAPGAACAIVTDSNLEKAHLPTLQASLDRAGVRHCSIVVPAGEASKSWGVFARVCDDIIAARMERKDVVVALGGGVVGDLAGFAAATIRRGMDFVQIPTSLLAQVDSSVGGKTAINSEHGKNLIGAFYQPSLVLADTGALASLPPREFRAGYAEVMKYGVIDDAPFFAWLERNWRGVFARGPELTEAIRKSCASKAAVVARDETRAGRSRAAESGTHVRPCAGKPDALRQRAARARRGRRHRRRVRHALFRPARSRERSGRRARRDASARCRAAHAHQACAGLERRPRPDPGSDVSGQEGVARFAHLHPRARHRPELHRARRAGRDRARFSGRRTARLRRFIVMPAKAGIHDRPQ